MPQRPENEDGFYADWPENDQYRAAGCFDTCCLLIGLVFFLLMLLLGAGGCESLPERQSSIALVWSVPWADKHQTGWCFFREDRIVICSSDPMVLYHELGHLLVDQDNRHHVGPWWKRWEQRYGELSRRWSWSF